MIGSVFRLENKVSFMHVSSYRFFVLLLIQKPSWWMRWGTLRSETADAMEQTYAQKDTGNPGMSCANLQKTQSLFYDLFVAATHSLALTTTVRLRIKAPSSLALSLLNPRAPTVWNKTNNQNSNDRRFLMLRINAATRALSSLTNFPIYFKIQRARHDVLSSDRNMWLYWTMQASPIWTHVQFRVYFATLRRHMYQILRDFKSMQRKSRVKRYSWRDRRLYVCCRWDVYKRSRTLQYTTFLHFPAGTVPSKLREEHAHVCSQSRYQNKRSWTWCAFPSSKCLAQNLIKVLDSAFHFDISCEPWTSFQKRKGSSAMSVPVLLSWSWFWRYRLQQQRQIQIPLLFSSLAIFSSLASRLLLTKELETENMSAIVFSQDDPSIDSMSGVVHLFSSSWNYIPTA